MEQHDPKASSSKDPARTVRVNVVYRGALLAAELDQSAGVVRDDEVGEPTSLAELRAVGVANVRALKRRAACRVLDDDPGIEDSRRATGRTGRVHARSGRVTTHSTIHASAFQEGKREKYQLRRSHKEQRPALRVPAKTASGRSPTPRGMRRVAAERERVRSRRRGLPLSPAASATRSPGTWLSWDDLQGDRQPVYGTVVCGVGRRSTSMIRTTAAQRQYTRHLQGRRAQQGRPVL